MSKDKFFVPLDGSGGYINRPIWKQEKNKSTYYDRKLDTQGVVPGPSLEEAIKAFEEEYHVKL